MATTSLQKQLNEVSQAKGKSSAGSVVKDLLSAPAMQKRF
ncbi:recombinase RecT, partial [Lacticaseibacillus paracasei]